MQSILFSTRSISSKQHYLLDESASRLMKDTESHYIYAKKFKRARKVHAKRKEQNSSSVSQDQSKKNKSAHQLKREEGYRVTFATSCLLKALERQPIEKIHNLQYDFKYLKQRAQNSGKESF